MCSLEKRFLDQKTQYLVYNTCFMLLLVSQPPILRTATRDSVLSCSRTSPLLHKVLQVGVCRHEKDVRGRI